MNRKVNIIMYHYVRELAMTRYPRIKGLMLSQFKEQLRFLRDKGYRFVSASQVLEAAKGGDALPENSVLLTFDDGYVDHYTNVFPLLDEMGIPAFFSMPGKIIAEKKLLDVNRVHFILASMPIEKIVPLCFQYLDHYRGSEFAIAPNEELYNKLAVASRFDDKDTIFVKRLLQVELPERLRNRITQSMFEQCVGMSEERFAGELYLSYDQVKTMKRHGMQWGIHGYDHYWMNRLGPKELERDIVSALHVFDGIVPRENWICCYPYGSVSDDVVKCVKRFGAGGGFSTEVRRADLDQDSIFALPRMDTNDFPPKSDHYLELE